MSSATRCLACLHSSSPTPSGSAPVCCLSRGGSRRSASMSTFCRSSLAPCSSAFSFRGCTGSGELGRLIADKILEHQELGYQIVGFIDDRAIGDHLGYRGLPLLGTLDEASEITARESVDHLYVALPPEQHVRMLDLLDSTSR